MANRYWVGGTGTWTTTTTNWSTSPGGAGGASAPTAADSVFFDQAGTYTVTMTGALNCLDITVSDGTVTFANGTTPTLTVAGSWSTIAGTVWSATGAITFNTAGSKTITTGGITINSPVTFNNATATWTLQDNLTFGNTLTTTLTAGTLALGSNTLTTGLFNSSNANTRTIDFGTGTIALVGSATATIWNTLSRAGLAILGTPNITSSGGGTTVTKTFALGYAPQGSGTYNLSLLETAGSVTYAFTLNDTVNNLTINGLQTVTIPTSADIPALKVYGNYTYASTNGTTTFTGSTAGIVFAGDNETTVDTGGVSTAYPMVFNAGNGKPGVRLQGSLSSSRGNDTGGFVGFPYPAFNQTSSNTYTIEFWVNFNSTPTAALSLLQNGRLGAALTVQFSGSTATFKIFHAGFKQYGVNAVFDVPLQEWHHIAIIGNSTNTWIAVNGVVKAFDSLWGQGAYTPNGSFPAGTFYSAAHSGDDTILYSNFGGYGSITYDYYISQFRIATGTVLIYNTSGFNPPAMPMQLTGVTGISCFITNTDTFTDLSASNGVLQVGSIRSTVATAPTREWIGSPPVAPTIRLLSNLNLGSNAMHLTNGNIDINGKTVTASGITIGGGVSTISNTGSSSYTPPIPITHTSGTLALGTNLTVTTGYTLTSGTLSLGSFTLTTPNFTSSNTNNRTINFGTGKIVLNTSVTSSTVWNTVTNTNLTISGTPLVECLGGGGTNDGPGQAVKNINTGAMTEANSISFSFLDTTNFVQYSFTNGSVVRNLIFNGSQRVGNYAITIYGSFTHENTNGTTTFIANTNTWTFAATSGSHNITPVAGYAYDFPWTFNGIGGTWVLQNNLTLGGLKTLTFVNGTLGSNNRTVTGTNGITMVTGTFTLNDLTTTASITHTSGTLNLSNNLTTAGYTLTAGTLALGSQTLTTRIFSSANANTRTINFGTGKIVLNGSITSTIWNTSTVTGLTVSGTSLVECQGGGTAVTKTINTGVLSAINAISFSLLETTGTVTYAFTASNVIRNLVVDGSQTISNIAITILGEFTHQTTNGTTIFSGGTGAWSFAATSGSYNISPSAGISGTGSVYVSSSSYLSVDGAQTALSFGTGDFTIESWIYLPAAPGAYASIVETRNITSAAYAFGVNSGLKLDFYYGSAGRVTSTSSVPVGRWSHCAVTRTSGTIRLFINGVLDATTGTFASAINATRTAPIIGALIDPLFFTGYLSNLRVVKGAVVYTGNFTPPTLAPLATSGSASVAAYSSTTNVNTSFLASTTSLLTCQSTTTFVDNSVNAFIITAIGTPAVTGVSPGATVYDFPINIGTTGTTSTYTLVNNLEVGATRQLTLNNGTVDFNNRNVGGNITFSNANNITLLNTGSTTASWTASITHTAGSLTLPFNLTTIGVAGYTLTAGTLNLNGLTLTTSIFSSSNANTRSIIFGSSNIILATTIEAQVNLAMAVTTRFTFTGTGGFVTNADRTRTFQFASTTAGGDEPNLTFTGSGIAVQTITTNSRFNTLNFGTTAFALPATSLILRSLVLSASGTFTGLSATMFRDGTITPNGKTIAALTINATLGTTNTTTLAGSLACTTYTQTAGTLDFATFNLTCSGAVTYTAGTLNNIGTITCTTWTCNDTFTLNQGTITPSTSFVVAVGGFNYNGGTLSSVTNFTHTAGVVNLNSNLTLATTSTYTFTAGTLNLNNFTLATGIFSSTNANIRSILFGTGNIVLAHTTAAQTVLVLANATNFNYTGTGGFITDASVTRTYTFGTTGGTFYNAPNLAIASGAAIPTFTTNSWFKNLDFTGSTCTPAAATINVGTLTLATGGTYTNLIPQFTRTQTWTSQFSKVLGGIGVNRLFTTLTLDGTQTFTTTSVCSVITGTLDLGEYDLTIGSFSSSGTDIRSVVFGTKNIILNHSVAAQTVLAIANATNFSYSNISGGFVSNASVTRTYVFGTTGGNIFNAPNLLISSGAAIQTITTNSWFNKLDFTGSTCTPAASTINVNNLTLASGGTFTGLSVTARASGNIIPNGKSIAALVINHSELGTTTLAGALICTTQSYINGNVDFAGFNLTGTAATYNNGVFSNINVLACTTFTIAGNFELITGTITPSTSVVLSSGSFTYTGGTLSPVGTFTHTAGTVVLNKAYALTATGTYTLTAGSLNLNGYNLTTGIFSSNNANTRSINFGTGNIILAHTTAAQTVLAIANATNFTTSGTGGFTSSMSVTRTFACSVSSLAIDNINKPNLSITGGAAVPTITTNSYFNKLDFTGSTCTPAVAIVNVNTLILASGGTYTNLTPSFTRTQTWSMQFSKQLAGLGVNIPNGTLTLDGTQTYTATSLCNLSRGTLDLGGSDLIIGTFESGSSNTRAISFGSNNIVLSTTAAGAVNINMPTVTNFTYTGTGGFTAAANITRTFTFGTTGGSLTNAPNLTFTGSGTAVQTLTTGGWFNKLDFGTTAFNPGTTSLNLNSLTLSSSGTYTGLTATMTGVGTIVSNGKTIAALNINAFDPANYKVYTWTSSGSMELPSVNAPPTVDLLLAGGGGGGSDRSDGNGGGGGGGGLVFKAAQSVLASTMYPITVGASAGVRQQGNDTTALGLTALGGGMGSGLSAFPTAGGSGGGGNTTSGDGARLGAAGLQPTSASGGFGNKGGNGWYSANGAGGGGAGGAGGNDSSSSASPRLVGGPGLQYSIDGTARYYSGGGGATASTGGLGSGASSYGGGGNGGAAGGPGIAIVRYLSSYDDLASTTGSPSVGIFNLPSSPGIVTLSGALTVSGRTTLINGRLNLNNFTLTCSAFDSSNTNPRSVDFGTGNIALAATIVLTVLDLGTATNFSWTGTGGFTSIMSLARTFRFGTVGGTASNAPNLSLTSGASVPTFSDGSWFRNLNFTGSSGTAVTTTLALGINVDTLTLATGGTYTGFVPVFTRTQTWTVQFGKQLGGIGCNIPGGTLTLDGTQTYTATSSCILTAGTLDLGGSNLTVGTFNSSNTNDRTVAFGNNNITLATTTAAAVNLSMADATNFSYTGTGGFTAAANITRTFTFGTTGGTATNAPNLTLTGSGTAIQTLTTNSWFNTLDFGTTAFNPGTITLNVNGFTLSTGGTFTGMTPTMRGTGTIIPNGKPISALTVNSVDGTTTLAGALSVAATATTLLTSGTLALGGFTLTTGIFSSSNTNTRSIQFGTGNIVLAHTTASTAVLSMATATGFTCSGTGGFASAMNITRTFFCGNTAGGRSANAPNLSLTSGAAVPSIASGSWFNTLNFTGTTSTPVAGTTVNVNSIILATGGTYTGLTVNMVGNGTITSNGKTIAALNINSDNPLALVEYKVYKFTSSGSITFSPASAPPVVEYLVVAGGGGGGGGVNSGTGGGGGGAGGLILSSAQMLSGTSYPVVVGGGGPVVDRSSGVNGTNSSFNGSIAIGGGYGAQYAAGGAGGSGGGGGGENGGGAIIAGGAGTAGQGNAGGSSASAGSSGGGGGAGAAASPAVGSVASSGGIGLSSTISGAPAYYSGGGGGGASAGGTAGAGGLGGGGAGKVGVIGDADAGEPGTANTGGGGGGGGGNLSGGSIGGAGGSGLVIIRYLASYADPLSTTGSPIVSTSMDSSPVLSSATNDISTLNDALTVTGTTTLTLGNLNLNNFTLTTSGLSSSNTNTRAIQFGTGNISLTGNAALAIADATNFTYTGTGGLTAAMSGPRTFTFGSTAGGSASNALNLSLTSGASVPTITVGSWFKVLNFTGTTSTPAATTVYVDTLTLATGGTYTGLTPIFTRTQTWTSQFSKVLAGIGFNLIGGTLTLDNTQTYSATSICNLIAGTLDLGGANLTVGRFVSNNSNTRAIAFGANNIVLATTQAGALNLDIVSAIGFTWTGTGGFVAAADIARKYTFGASIDPPGAEVYTTPGTYSWVVPIGVTQICAVLVGAGASGGQGNGGAGGSLRYINDLPVTPGETLSIFVGQGGGLASTGPTTLKRGSNTILLAASNNSGGSYATPEFPTPSTTIGAGVYGGTIGGGNGGSTGGGAGLNYYATGGGGAGGYSGDGGAGLLTVGNSGSGGGGGGGGGYGFGQSAWYGGGGGGVGIYGEGPSGGGGANVGGAGGGGSGGTNGSGSNLNTPSPGGLYGGGGGGHAGQSTAGRSPGGNGAARIIWGTGRAFPSALVAAEYDIPGGNSGSAAANSAPNLTFTGSGTAVQTIVSGSWLNNLNFGTTAFAVPNATINVSTLTLSSTGTYTGLVPLFTSTQTWTPQHSKVLGGIGVNTAGVTLTLGSSQELTKSSTVIVNAGTLNLNNIGLQCYNFSSTGTGSRSITGGEINVNNNWTVVDGAGFNASGSTINMIAITGKTFAGGSGAYGTLVQKSEFPLSITGSNSFENLQVSSDMIDSTVVAGEVVYTTPGTYSWLAPAGVTSVSVVCVGGGGAGRGGGLVNWGGGGGGGGLGWKNNITVTPGQTYTVVVGAGPAGVAGVQGTHGGDSYFIDSLTVAGLGGKSAAGSYGAFGAGGSYVGDGGGAGGSGGSTGGNAATGGGGAGGYTGNGGAGGGGNQNGSAAPAGGGGGGGGGAQNSSGSNMQGGGGGGVGIYGEGSSGGGGSGGSSNSSGGAGGSNGTNGTDAVNRFGGAGGAYGGGGGGGLGGSGTGQTVTAGSGMGGAVRIIWGFERTYPLASPATIDFMIVGGGAGSLNLVSAGDSNSGIGGAGAGGVVIQNEYAVPPVKSTGNPQTIIVTVGSGGTPNGSNTTLTSSDGLVSFTALGGGLPGVYTKNGGAGGSGGGGGGRDYPAGDGGAGLQPASASGGYGNNGGRCRTGNNGGGSAAGGGGGGAGGVGANGVQQQGGAGGIGIASNMLTGPIAQNLNIGEVSNTDGFVYFAGGGGGMANGTGGAGGLGGGARGASSVFQGTGVVTNTQSNATGLRNGKANTGGGAGGAAGFTNYGGTGGSGVVVIREFRTIKPSATVTGGCTITYDGLYILYVFKSSGTITFTAI